MNDKKTLLDALRNLKVQTGSLVCLGCGHERNCSTKGCAILRKVEFAIGGSQVYQCRNCDFYEGGLGTRCFNKKSPYAGRMVRPENSCDHCSIDLLTESEKARSDLAKRLAAITKQHEQLSQGAAMMTKKLSDTLEELAQVKAERDAAVKCLEDAHACETCQHMDTHPDCDVECLGCQKDCTCRDCRDGSNFKWRGEPGETAMTNGDRFRCYTDEELVDLLYQDYLNFSDRDGTEDPSTKWCDMKGGCQGEETSECTTELHKACILRWLREKDGDG